MIAPTNQQPIEFTFTNEHGERWMLRVDPQAETAELTGDELGESTVQIVDDEIQSDLIFSDREASWLAECWETVTGRQLQTNPFQQLLAQLRQAPGENGEG
ncbi:MAG TPA: hypothetical protein QF564_29645 [Pirellulaceae bacterium]|nr:hypothetical protein [Pirellulaceae bacterium]